MTPHRIAGCRRPAVVGDMQQSSTSSPVCTVNLMALASAAGAPTAIPAIIGSKLTAVESAATAPGVTISPTAPSLYQQTINFNNQRNAEPPLS